VDDGMEEEHADKKGEETDSEDSDDDDDDINVVIGNFRIKETMLSVLLYIFFFSSMVIL
jgi:hypothetical protein